MKDEEIGIEILVKGLMQKGLSEDEARKRVEQELEKSEAFKDLVALIGFSVRMGMRK